MDYLNIKGEGVVKYILGKKYAYFGGVFGNQMSIKDNM